MRTRLWSAALLALFLLIAVATYTASQNQGGGGSGENDADARNHTHALHMLRKGRLIFRFDTFGSEHFWGDQLGLHLAIAGEKNGGVGKGLSPRAALEAGLKVDLDALPPELVAPAARARTGC